MGVVPSGHGAIKKPPGHLGTIFKTGCRNVGQAFQPDVSAAKVRLESLTYDS
jgi:hypothetical protein